MLRSPLAQPEVVKTVTNEEVTTEALGGARTHTRTSGVAHKAFANDVAAMESVRDLVSFLPSNNTTSPTRLPTEDPVERADPALDAIVPADPNVPYDMGCASLSLSHTHTLSLSRTHTRTHAHTHAQEIISSARGRTTRSRT